MTSKIILPIYTTKLPSNGTLVEFRPFTVKEEKSLLLALQENNIDTVTTAIKNVVSVCTDGRVNPKEVPYYDIEFLWLQIRSKSVGEIIDLVGSCECSEDAATPFSIDIADAVIVPTPHGNATIKIPDTQYTIVFRHPSIDDFAKTFDVSTDSSPQVVANCMISVYTDDEVMNWSAEEKLEFVYSMTPKQQKGIAQFLQDMPMVKMNATYTCKMCGKNHSTNLSGYENFFV